MDANRLQEGPAQSKGHRYKMEAGVPRYKIQIVTFRLYSQVGRERREEDRNSYCMRDK
jgi:hypothetical protein